MSVPAVEANSARFEALRLLMPFTARSRRFKAAVKGTLGLRGTKRVSVLTGPARGARMTIDLSCQTPQYLGTYEWELHRFLRKTVPGARLVFDVGANVGYECLMLAALGNGLVVAFEPDPATAEMLHANVDDNPALCRRITVIEEAIGSHPGAGVTTIDEAAAQFGPPDVVKIDIDGGECDALRGGRRTLTQHRPHLIVETHSPELERDCGALLIEYGYAPVIKHNRKIWREYRGHLEVNRWLLAER